MAKVPDNTRVYAIGDIHGMKDMLDGLLQLIAKDMRGYAGRVILVVLGDMIDRGPDSRGVLELLMNMQVSPPIGFDEVVCLKGNHENMMLRYIEASHRVSWLVNGGDKAVESYKIDEETMDVDSFRRHANWVMSLPACAEIGDYVFVHAGIRPGLPIAQQSEQDMLWIREQFLTYEGDHGGKVVVHGHTPSRNPEDLPARINVDTGSCFKGCLTAVVLEGESRRFIQTAKEG